MKMDKVQKIIGKKRKNDIFIIEKVQKRYS